MFNVYKIWRAYIKLYVLNIHDNTCFIKRPSQFYVCTSNLFRAEYTWQLRVLLEGPLNYVTYVKLFHVCNIIILTEYVIDRFKFG